MMTLHYEIRFYDYWHLGSGLSAGAKLDSTVVKTGDGLPFVPGKTLKGVLRELAESEGECTFVNACFGGSTDEQSPCYEESAKNVAGLCRFANAQIAPATAKSIAAAKQQEYLYDTIASTKIGENGVAEDKSLREIEVVVPMVLEGYVSDIPDAQSYEKLARLMQMVKRMGLGRNRGLGRCEITVKGEK